MDKKIIESLTYDDVLLVPQYSAINSRKDVSLKTFLAKGVELNLPIIAAPMDTVCESAMAIAVARCGGIGIIHRFNTIENQAIEVQKVKRSENYVVDKPFTIGPKTKLKEILNKVEVYNATSFLVADAKNRLLGLVCKRDYIFETDLNTTAEKMMKPFKNLVVTNRALTLEESSKIFKKHKIEKLPIVNSKREIKGLITVKDLRYAENTKAARDIKGRLLVGAAIGIKDDYIERSRALIEAGVDILGLDVAHGHMQRVLDAVKELKHEFGDTPLMVGNIATAAGAADLKKAGADVVKVGIGPGAACTTRVVAGSGVPQFTAVMNGVSGAGKTPVVADGGARTSGDMIKALAAGASAVMFGSLLAGTDEAPGKILTWNGKKVKMYRGMASFNAYQDKQKRLSKRGEVSNFTAEGIDQGFVPYKGSVVDILAQLEGGIRSGFTYSGAKKLSELWQKAEFTKITQAGFKESGAHDVML